MSGPRATLVLMLCVRLLRSSCTRPIGRGTPCSLGSLQLPCGSATHTALRNKAYTSTHIALSLVLVLAVR